MRRNAIVVVLVGALLAAACGGGDDEAGGDDDRRPAEGAVLLTTSEREAADPGADVRLAGQAVTGFGADLLAAVAADGGSGNVVVSPLSVALVLALTEPGATGAAQEQLRQVLGATDPAAFHASMSALEQRLLDLAAPPAGGDGEPGELVLRLADRAYLQDGYPFEPTYLDAIGSAYGPVLHGVDYEPDPDAVAHEINAFVDDVTDGLIPRLIEDGVLSRDTVLTLVNALYLKASWQEAFEASATEDGPFTRADGSSVTVPFLHGKATSSARGEEWVGATKAYVGGLVAQLILPDEGQMDAVVADLPAVLADYADRAGPGGPLALPKLETRFTADVSTALQAMGLTAPYERGGLLGIADDESLVLSKVLHETYLAVDEEGTEAAAATAAVFEATSAPVEQPLSVVLDRPFVLRIFDPASDATLFLGVVNDPTA